MEVYTFPQQGLKDAYTIPDTHSNSCFTSGSCQQFENMYSEGAPEYFLDQGLYYHSGTGYGYVCSGFESPCKWDDHHHSSFGLDGQDAYAGAQTDNFPFLYYSPSYGYGQSPYNPYNPYIPGAMVGADGQFLGAPHYYTISPYDNSSSPVYFPIPVHSKPELTGSNSTDETVDSNSSIASRAKGSVLKHNISSASSAFTSTLLGPTASNRANSFTKVSSGTESHTVTCRQPAKHGNVTSSTLSHPISNQILQNGSAQTLDYVARGKPVPSHAQLKATLPRSDGLSVGSSIHGQHTGDKLPSKFLYERVLNDTKACCNGFTEQGRGPKMDKQRNQLTLKAYSSTAGNADAQGNVIIYIDQFNKDDIVTDYASAKFFVIKSYSEDDVHKSIKYGVWSSTANGNKKLNNAYEDAQRIAKKDSGSCPVFLFFSVNASGQFCGVAEMTGPVDFHRDMDFWQQDKWNGSFPVKWHIIKDVPNPSVRHITLENNENKPVTNSRDTQEVRHRRGVEMLKVFKNYVPKTSLFDDFMYYENREKILLEEKARLLIRSCDYPFLLPVLKHQQVSSVIDLPSKGDAETEPKRPTKSDKYVAESAQVGHLAGDASSTAANESSKRKNSANSGNDVAASAEMVCLAGTTNSSTSANESSTVVSEQAHSDAVSSMGTPATSSSKPESEVVPITVAKDSASTDVMTIGSMPVKVNGYADPCGFLRFGTVDATAFQHDKAGYVGKGGK